MNQLIQIPISLACTLIVILSGCLPVKQSDNNNKFKGYKLIAHRGGIVEGKYNAFDPASIQAAIDQGYYMLEVDVRATKDGMITAVVSGAVTGIRDVEEWYMSILTRPDYLRYIFDEQTDIVLVNRIDVLFLCKLLKIILLIFVLNLLSKNLTIYRY